MTNHRFSDNQFAHYVNQVFELGSLDSHDTGLRDHGWRRNRSFCAWLARQPSPGHCGRNTRRAGWNLHPFRRTGTLRIGTAGNGTVSNLTERIKKREFATRHLADITPPLLRPDNGSAHQQPAESSPRPPGLLPALRTEPGPGHSRFRGPVRELRRRLKTQRVL